MKEKIPPCVCDETCIFSFGGEMTTLLYYPPRYNAEGVNINPDNNTVSGDVRCNVHKREWTYEYRNRTPSDIKFTEIINDSAIESA